MGSKIVEKTLLFFQNFKKKMIFLVQIMNFSIWIHLIPNMFVFFPIMVLCIKFFCFEF